MHQLIHTFLQRAAARYGTVLRYPFGPLSVYLVSHPDGVKQIAPGQHVAVEPSVPLRPKHGLMMTLQPRT